jgi:serine/threonine protein kinase/WD40 repeat protein
VKTPSEEVRELFLAAIDQPSTEEIREFVAAIRRRDSMLGARLARLVDAHLNSTPFMKGPAMGGLDFRVAEWIEDESLVGQFVNNYRIEGLIGQGGMGSVYRAFQTSPVEREVALKVIRPGMATRQVVSRFAAERQALASMNHPGIATVLDAGKTDSGQPYFVMELVDGVPITEFCTQQKLKLRARIELVISVCEAVQHAHQKGIIHRDLKPSNILVEQVPGERSIPKVIDFGISKSVDASTMLTRTGETGLHQLVGTPEYMSPEQLRSDGADTDVRSDVYTLGLILYELCAGLNPFRSKVRDVASFDGVRTVILETEPTPPSQADGWTVAIRNHESKPESHGRLIPKSELRGDLDWIVMKAIEKDKARRYDTVEAFAADLRRFLNHEPVYARRPSAAYRFSKLYRRQRAPVLLSMALLCSLIFGLGFSILKTLDARDAQMAAEKFREKATAEAFRYRELAWRSGIRDAYSDLQNRQLMQSRATLERLRLTDDRATVLPEWLLLKAELDRTLNEVTRTGSTLTEVRLIPNEAKAAIAGDDSIIRIVDLQTSKVVREINTQIPSIHALAISPDGQLIAAGGTSRPGLEEARPYLFELSSGKQLGKFPEQASTVESLEFSTFNQLLICGPRYEPVSVFELSGNRRLEIPGNRRNQWLAISSSGLVATQETPDSIRITSLNDPAFGHSLPLTVLPTQAIWLGDSDLLGVFLDGVNYLALQVYCGRSGELISSSQLLDAIGVRCLKVSPDLTQVYAGTMNGEIISWPLLVSESESDRELSDRIRSDLHDSIPLMRLRISGSHVTSLVLESGRIFATTFSGELISIQVPEPVTSIQTLDSHRDLPVFNFAFDPTGEFLLVVAQDGSIKSSAIENLMAAVDLDSSYSPGLPQRRFAAVKNPHWEEINGTRLPIKMSETVAISTCQNLVAVVQAGEAHVLDGRKVIHRFSTATPAPINAGSTRCAAAFCLDGKRLAWMCQQQLQVNDLKTGSESIYSELPWNGHCVEWSEDERRLFIGGISGEILEMNLETEKIIPFCEVGVPTRVIHYSEKLGRLISGHDDGAVRVWSLQGELTHVAHLHEYSVRSISLCSESRVGVSQDVAGNIAIWYPDELERIGMLISGRRFEPNLEVFSPRVAMTKSGDSVQTAFLDSTGEFVLQRWQIRP